MSAHILIIDDNPSDVHLLRRALNAYGEFHINVAHDGEEAMEFIRKMRRQKESRGYETEPLPCVIALDLHMPKYDGIQVLQAIRQDAELSHVEVVVLTGGASAREQAEILSLGARCQAKPSRLTEFEDLAANLAAICGGLQPVA